MLNNNIRTKIDKLKSSPIYAMSLGSKELFHSNFWAWIMENTKFRNEFIHFFFPNIEINGDFHITREQKNRDITIWNENKTHAYIIENKLKSIPTEGQLIKYQADLSDKFNGGVLTGIEKPRINLDAWRFISYKEIAEKLMYLAYLDEKYNQIILEYAENIKDIHSILEETSSHFENKLPDNNNNFENALSEINIWDIFQKSVASKFIDYFTLKFKEDIAKLDLEIGAGYSNKQTIMDFSLKYNSDINLGIQIQGLQFRLVAIRFEIDKCDEIYSEFLEKTWFDKDFSKENKYIFGYTTKMTPSNKPNCTAINSNYNKYQNKDSSFVYQYFDINESNNSFETLSKLILHFLNKAKKIIENNNISC